MDKKEKQDIPYIFPINDIMSPFHEAIGFDPLGSYTGIMEDVTEKPVQDADDL